jgi:tetratricopeptide (TPR) repeat protein
LTFGPDAKPPSFEEAKAAAASLEAMVAANPNMVAPYLPLAYLYNTDFGHTRAGASGARERARAFDLAKTALALDRVNAHAYTAVGWSYLRRRQWEPARLHFQQALARNPYHVRRLMEAGYGFIFLGDLDTARTLLDRCLALNPSPRDGFFTDLGLIAMIRGDYDQAGSYFELAAEPEIWGSVFSLMNAELAGQPDRDNRDAAVSRIRTIWPPERPLSCEAIVDWLASHHPFKSAEVETRLLRAARDAFQGV